MVSDEACHSCYSISTNGYRILKRHQITKSGYQYLSLNNRHISSFIIIIYLNKYTNCFVLANTYLTAYSQFRNVTKCYKNTIFPVVPEQSTEWIELKRSSPVQIHEPLILIQSNPADDRESESSPVQSGHNRIGIYQISCKIDM